MLLEQPGAWGADALTESALPPQVATHLAGFAARLPARVLLLRRTGGAPHPGAGRSLFVAYSDTDHSWLERFQLDHARDVLDMSLDELTAGRSVGGDPVTDPLYLVCTNGKHDPCCAEYGLPVARALAETAGDRLWECSHVGGDRFAGNLVCLPDGVFYGHLDADIARAAVAAHEQRRVLLDAWRGRSPVPFAAQAAEGFVRRELGIDGLDHLRYLGVERRGAIHHARFALARDREVSVEVRETRIGVPRALTCAGEPTVAPAFELVGLADVERL